MQSVSLPQVQVEKLVCTGLPLAVYREVAAHLSQIKDLDVSLESQRSSDFDYHQSQIGTMVLRYPSPIEEESHQRIEQILEYYAKRHGKWQRETVG